MKCVRTDSLGSETEWDSFALSGCDFRPQFDGFLYNLSSVVPPLDNREQTESFMKDCVLKIAAWILENRSDFDHGDRFQIIIGWPNSVRETARQVIKIGGGFDRIEEIASGAATIELRDNWSLGIFDGDDR